MRHLTFNKIKKTVKFIIKEKYIVNGIGSAILMVNDVFVYSWIRGSVSDGKNIRTCRQSGNNSVPYMAISLNS